MIIPAGHQVVMPYLILNDGAKFLEFTKDVFNAEVLTIHMRADDKKKIMHAEVKISGNTIMFADSTDQYQPQTAGLFVYVENADQSFEKAIAAGGSVVTELTNQDYGRSGGIKDPTGSVWWITSIENPS